MSSAWSIGRAIFSLLLSCHIFFFCSLLSAARRYGFCLCSSPFCRPTIEDWWRPGDAVRHLVVDRLSHCGFMALTQLLPPLFFFFGCSVGEPCSTHLFFDVFNLVHQLCMDPRWRSRRVRRSRLAIWLKIARSLRINQQPDGWKLGPTARVHFTWNVQWAAIKLQNGEYWNTCHYPMAKESSGLTWLQFL